MHLSVITNFPPKIGFSPICLTSLRQCPKEPIGSTFENAYCGSNVWFPQANRRKYYTLLCKTANRNQMSLVSLIYLLDLTLIEWSQSLMRRPNLNKMSLGPSIKYVTPDEEGSEKVWQFVTGEGSRACDVTLRNFFTIHVKHEISSDV